MEGVFSLTAVVCLVTQHLSALCDKSNAYQCYYMETFLVLSVRKKIEMSRKNSEPK